MKLKNQNCLRIKTHLWTKNSLSRKSYVIWWKLCFRDVWLHCQSLFSSMFAFLPFSHLDCLKGPQFLRLFWDSHLHSSLLSSPPSPPLTGHHLPVCNSKSTQIITEPTCSLSTSGNNYQTVSQLSVFMAFIGASFWALTCLNQI